MSSLRPPCSPAANAVPAPGRSRPRRPVAAVLADRLDDVPVVEAAARLAAARGAPLLLIAVLPPLPPRAVAAPPDGVTVRAVLGRALPHLARVGIGYEPAVYHRPAGRGGRLCAARSLLDVAIAHGCSRMVVSRSGPAGLDANTVMEAAAIRGGPFVHAAPPVPWAPLTATRSSV
ncbi:universal stress protein [Streptomyces marokkonensis]|uniref:universal stress protein n=1 Tax=Streptomyces marokkonensis TaxID=324855 RepID=UPI001FCAA7D1|nr:universal stress protein [Streptomyces marokkonensis]